MHRIALLVGLALALFAQPAFANRFGPPWQARVTADRTTVFSQPDASSPPVGPLQHGQLVVVTTADDGSEWIGIPDGWVRANDLTEETAPWVAEVTSKSVSIYARPSEKEPIRRTAKQGDLLRVTGVSPGIEGETNTWWATTEGYVGLNTVKEASSDWAKGWTMPVADLALKGWWANLKSQANVRAGASLQAPIVGTLLPGDRIKVLEEVQGDAVNGNATWERIDGGRYAGAVVHSSLLARLPDPLPVVTDPPDMSPPVAWIAVSRATSTLTYFDADSKPQFTTFVSLGRAGVDTPEGDYRTDGKYRFDNMSSATVENADHAYHLPNVPFVQYYRDGGYAIHGTYWHDQFGSVESQGCINLTWTDSAYLFRLTLPQVAPEDIARWAVGSLPATPLRILN